MVRIIYFLSRPCWTPGMLCVCVSSQMFCSNLCQQPLKCMPTQRKTEEGRTHHVRQPCWCLLILWNENKDFIRNIYVTLSIFSISALCNPWGTQDQYPWRQVSYVPAKTAASFFIANFSYRGARPWVLRVKNVKNLHYCARNKIKKLKQGWSNYGPLAQQAVTCPLYQLSLTVLFRIVILSQWFYISLTYLCQCPASERRFSGLLSIFYVFNQWAGEISEVRDGCKVLTVMWIVF